MELWTVRIPEAGQVESIAARVEAAGWDGVAFTDSQNLIADPFVGIALAGRSCARVRFGTAVTNAATRVPAALATLAATVQEAVDGRFVLGIGRGDTALFHLGRKPQPVAAFAVAIEQLQTYLGGGTVDCNGHPSRIQWLDRATQPKVPLDVAASGPKIIALAARLAERITFAVGADPDRMAWAVDLARAAAAESGRDPASISFGAYVNVGCDPDLSSARSMIAGSVAAFAHFSSMPGSTGAGLADGDKEIVAEVGRRYDSNVHLRNDADHASGLAPDFVDRFAVVGSSEQCVSRLQELASLGLERFVVTGASFGADPAAARAAGQRIVQEVLPALR